MVLVRCTMMAAVLSAAACTHEARVPSRPASDILSNYDAPVAGRFALHVDAEAMRYTAVTPGVECSATEYPTDGRAAFRTSVVETVERVFEVVEVVDAPLTREDLIAQGLTGLVRIEAEDMHASVQIISNWTSTEIEADVEMEASVTVDGITERALAAAVDGDARAIAPAGGACEGGAEAISRAAGDALDELLRSLGRQLSNSPRVRSLDDGGLAGLDG